MNPHISSLNLIIKPIIDAIATVIAPTTQAGAETTTPNKPKIAVTTVPITVTIVDIALPTVFTIVHTVVNTPAIFFTMLITGLNALKATTTPNTKALNLEKLSPNLYHASVSPLANFCKKVVRVSNIDSRKVPFKPTLSPDTIFWTVVDIPFQPAMKPSLKNPNLYLRSSIASIRGSMPNFLAFIKLSSLNS